MTGRQGFAISVLILFLTCFGAAALADVDAVAPSHRSSDTARFLVHLKVETSSEGTLPHPEAVAKQRQAIRFANEAVRRALAGRSHRVIREYRSIPFIAVEGGSDMLAALGPMASTVSRDHLFRPSLAESVPLIGANQAWTQGFDGSGSVVTLLDTGVDSQHPFFAGKIVGEACYSGNGGCQDGSDTQLGPGAAAPCAFAPSACQHGTYVAGIAAGSGETFSGVARGAQIMAVQVFSKFSGADCDGSGENPCALAYTSDLVAALEHVYESREQHHIAAVNMSLGGAVYLSPAKCDADNGAMKAIIDTLRSVGIATVVSAGNGGAPNGISAPACISSAVSVGAITKTNEVASFSNTASFLSLLAPGVSIRSSVPGGGFAFFSGTSMAAPHVTGAWAVLKQKNPGATVAALLDALTVTGMPLSDAKNTIAKPRIDVAGAVALSAQAPPRSTLSVSKTGPGVVTRVPAANFADVTAPIDSQSLASASALPTILLEQVATGLAFPVSMTHAGDGSGRLFIVLQQGKIVIYDGTRILPTAFLDLTSLLSCCGERGLLGLAFHPNYRNNGFFYVNYTNTAGNTVIARYKVTANPNIADFNSAVPLLTIAQPYTNHKGGQLQFGPDGYLYIATGDGGSSGDPQNRAQNLGELLGKILRIDVNDPVSPYVVPSSNPFVGTTGARPETWAWGLRNPWRFSFDRLTGDLFIADVGQSAREEVNFQPATSRGGENYGWRKMEGTACFNPSSGCNTGTLTLPILEYTHASGDCTVIGGYRYRGTKVSGLVGTYIYGDFCTGRIWGAIPSGAVWSTTLLLDLPFQISTFGEDQAGELYIAQYGAAGTISRIKGETAPMLTLNGGSSPITVAPGTTVTVGVQNGPGNRTDRIALYQIGAADSAYLNWLYLNGTQTAPASGLTTATVSFAMPAASATYEFRFFANDGATKLATSSTVTVTTANIINVAAAIPNGEFAFVVNQNFGTPGDTNASPAISVLRIFENGVELSPAHSLHADIRSLGGGRFSHWGSNLFFSASNNTDPRTNGRTYTYQIGSAPVGPPAAPSGLTATATSSITITLTWTDQSTNESGFKIERALGAGAFTPIVTVGANITTYADSGLTANTTYSYRVRATNAAGDSAYSNTVSATTAGVINVAAAIPNGGFAFVVNQNFGTPGDTNASPTISVLRIFENGVELSPAHSLHANIRSLGGGRFSHWGSNLFFSASNNTDPRTNGRTYTYQIGTQ